MGRISVEYAAGFFDGEGSVSISYLANKTGRGWWRVVAVVAQNDRRPLDALKERWGGFIGERRTPEGRTHFDWRVTTKLAHLFFEEIRPYLIVKAEAVDIALSFREGIGENIVGKAGMTPEEHERRMALREQLRLVNGKRGRVA